MLYTKSRKRFLLNFYDTPLRDLKLEAREVDDFHHVELVGRVEVCGQSQFLFPISVLACLLDVSQPGRQVQCSHRLGERNHFGIYLLFREGLFKWDNRCLLLRNVQQLLPSLRQFYLLSGVLPKLLLHELDELLLLLELLLE